MSRATTITELYALLDERRATISRPGDASVPRERWLPAAESAKSAEGGVASSGLYDASGRAPLAAHPGATVAPRGEPAEGSGQGHLGSALAGPVWAWVDPAVPGRFDSTSAGVAAPFSRPLPPQIAPAPQPWTPRGAPAHAAVLPASAPTELRMPLDVLRAMAAAAAATGRTETDVWAAAAREWLYHHAGGNDPQPPDPAASAWPPSAPRTARDQSWTAIDILLGDLRTDAPPRRLPPEPIQVDRAA